MCALVTGVQTCALPSSGAHGPPPAQLVQAWRAHRAGVDDVGLVEDAERDGQGLEAGGDEAVEGALRGGLLVEVEGLRIVEHCKVEYLRLAEVDALAVEGLARLEVVEVAFLHRKRLCCC